MNRSELQRAVRKCLGPSGRVRYRNGAVEVGVEEHGRFALMGRGSSPDNAWRSLYDATREAAGLERVFTRPPAPPKPLSGWARFVAFVLRVFSRRKELPANA